MVNCYQGGGKNVIKNNAVLDTAKHLADETCGLIVKDGKQVLVFTKGDAEAKTVLDQAFDALRKLNKGNDEALAGIEATYQKAVTNLMEGGQDLSRKGKSKILNALKGFVDEAQIGSNPVVHKAAGYLNTQGNIAKANKAFDA